MIVTMEGNILLIKTKEGKDFIITEGDKLKIETPDGRIMYGTEEGNNNAEFLLLIK